MKKPIREFELRNVSPDDFINQAKGLKLVKERKRQEKKLLNISRFAQAIQTKISKVNTDFIQRGFNLATKWKKEAEENVDKSIN